MPEKINCIIVDDEPKMIELLEDSLTELYPDIEIAGKYTNWKNVLERLRNSPPDILFLDISMPGKTGFDLLDLISGLESEIIFVTAHTEFALDAFNFDVCGYILKPIDDKSLIKTVDRGLNRIKKKREKLSVKRQIVGVPDATGIRYVNINDIVYCETENRYTKVVTTKEEIMSSYNIGKYQETLIDNCFYQIHRSFIINLNHVTRYDSTGIVIMSNNKEIPISRKNKDEFLKIFNRVGK